MFKKGVLVFAAISVMASALNYIVYPLYARILPASEYVHITVALSLFTQISAFLSSIIAITISLSKSENGTKVNEKIELLQAFLFKLFFILAILFLAFSPLVMRSIHTPALFSLPISLMMLFSIPILIVSGYLNGKNKMVKLGLVALVSAGCQFLIGVTTSLLSGNGLITMLSISVAQVMTIAIVYALFAKENLPSIIKPITMPVRSLRDRRLKGLLLYTALSAVAVMMISLIQIIDLFIMPNISGINLKFYTDLYVISRVVFFAGLIFVWPFLGEINLDHHHFNRKPFATVLGYFALIGITAIVGLYGFGDKLALFLFGSHYQLHTIQYIGTLSVLYKVFMLVITAIVLYFIVLRRYTAIWFTAIASGLIIIYSRLVSRHSSMAGVLFQLDVITGTLVILGVILLLTVPVRQSATSGRNNNQ